MSEVRTEARDAIFEKLGEEAGLFQKPQKNLNEEIRSGLWREVGKLLTWKAATTFHTLQVESVHCLLELFS